ncbi:acyltransferase [Streptomyces sp. SPB162]|uniref:acyltransferase family protein n=1 Tax=Streptomyces sp. SPB162 TaxID=2940560 RepID=UPI00240766AC|nr:acyltransferase [Streptomyces sp. SPB162]MDF9816962.1 peptidoglycan/LPS O-acetylase OafA/YrhL [Streptomyces sp. SPB162]
MTEAIPDADPVAPPSTAVAPATVPSQAPPPGAARARPAGPAGPAGPEEAPARGRLPSLTGLRFAAAFLVFGFHLQVAHLFPAGSRGDLLLGRVFGHGAIGVSFFFILSGYVLTWSARPGEPAARTWRKRAAKVYPNHLVSALAALVAVAGGAASAAGGASAGIVVPNLLLVQSWSNDPDVYYGLNTVSWSLSCEAFFYLLFPWLLRGLTRLGPKALWPSAAVLTVLTCCLPLVTRGWSEPTAYWFLYVLPATRVTEFCLGMVLARIVRTGQWIRFPVWAAGLLLVAAYVAVGHLPTRWGYVAVTVVPLALLIPALATADLAGRRTLWSTRRAVWLGEVSFAFYMTHQLVIRFVSKALHVPATSAPDWGAAQVIAVQLGMLAGSLCAAWLLWRIVERPLHELLRGGTGRRRGHPGRSGTTA